MTEYRFEDVTLVLAEPNRDLRNSIKTSLYGRGFGDVVDTGNFLRTESLVSMRPPDLIIADTELLDGDTCAMVENIRHHRLGENPFIPVILVSKSSEMVEVRRVINAGADDLLVKPIRLDALLERIVNLIRARKPFVVTSDYIGPDRRKQKRIGPGIPMFDVPNTLKAKALGEADPEALRREIAAAVATINNQKMERNAHQIEWLVVRIAGGHLAAERRELLERLLITAEDLSRRMVGTPFAHVSDLCNSLTQVTRSLLESGAAPDSRDLRLLPHLAEAIRAAFTEDRRTVALARDITESVGHRAAR